MHTPCHQTPNQVGQMSRAYRKCSTLQNGATDLIQKWHLSYIRMTMRIVFPDSPLLEIFFRQSHLALRSPISPIVLYAHTTANNTCVRLHSPTVYEELTLRNGFKRGCQYQKNGGSSASPTCTTMCAGGQPSLLTGFGTVEMR